MKGKLKKIVLIFIIIQGFSVFIYTLFHAFANNINYKPRSNIQNIRRLESEGLVGIDNTTNLKDNTTSKTIKSVVAIDNTKPETIKSLEAIDNTKPKTIKSLEAIDNTKPKTIKEVEVSTRQCKGLKFEPHLLNENDWLPIDGSKNQFVFSAFYIQSKAKIFIIGAKHIRTIGTVCQCWYHDKGTGEMLVKEHTTLARMSHEGHGKIFSSVVYECPLGTADMPSYVSLSTKPCQAPMNMLQVRNASTPDKYKNTFTVCLSPLYFKFGRAYELIEWIELNRILGANKFIVYNHSTAINVDHVLGYYSKRGLAEVVQWRLPMAVSTYPGSKQRTEIHYFGQTAALNDCLFRSKHESEFIVNEDLDEFIIPHRNELFNWTDIIKTVGSNSEVFLFRSTYFRKEWDNNLDNVPERDMAEKYKLITLQKFEHDKNIFPPRQRSKYIARTATVDNILIHEVPNKNTFIVSTQIGLVHHYRNWFNQKDRINQVRDETVRQKFGVNLIKRVQGIWKELPGEKMDIPWEFSNNKA